MLTLSSAFSEFGNHGCEDREQFAGFAQQPFQRIALDAAIIAQQFQPELRFIRLLQQTIQF
jgi:hypothetical protein